MPRWLTWPLLATALAALNASLTFVNVWPTPRIRPGAALSVEVALVVVGLVLAGRRADRLARGALPSVWVLLVAGRYLDVTAPGLYGREFNIYWDAPHLGNVASMLVRAVPAWQAGLAGMAALALVAVIWAAARVALRQVAAGATARAPRLVLLALATTVIILFVLTPAGSRATAPVPLASPVSAAYARQVGLAVALMAPGQAAPALGDSPGLDGPFPALDQADVVLAFVEAYGAITYDDPALAQRLAGARGDLVSRAHEVGRVVVSAFVESPTFGASSWLAHLTLLTGVPVHDQYAYVAVMRSARDTLPRAFGRQGYRTIALMPGMRQPWPEGAFYGFDHIYDYAGLAYGGPKFGWWAIPDQFTLARLADQELRAGNRRPVLAVFPTGTTHAPFGPVPPYQPDWTRVLGPEPFERDAVAASLASPPDLTNLSPSYADATAYALTTFAGYVRAQAGKPQVLVLVGDHQPVAAVTGPGASRDVPVHVIASPGVVVDRLRAAGFVGGITPARPVLGGMHELTPILLDAFRGTGAEPPSR